MYLANVKGGAPTSVPFLNPLKRENKINKI
jgi:hypothetical protein